MGYEVRAMSFGEILDVGFRLLRDNFALLVGIPAVIYIPLSVATSWFSANPQAATSGFAIGIGLVAILLFTVGSPIVSAAVTYAVGQIYLDRAVTFNESFGVGFSILLPLVGTTLLYFLAVFVGLLLFVIPGVYLGLALMLVWQIMVLERVFGVAALKRSRELMRGNLLRGFGVLFIGGLIVGVISSVLQLVLGFIPLLGPIGAGLAEAAGGAYTTAIAVVLYFDIRCRKEAFDLEHLAQMVEARGASGMIAGAGQGGPLVR